MRLQLRLLLMLCGALLLQGPARAGEHHAPAQLQAEQWRAQHRLVDLHQHLDYTPELLARAIKVMDAAGLGLAVDLTPGTVTPGPNSAPSEFEQHKKMEDTLFPGRWVQYMNLDYRNWDQPDFAQQAVRQVEQGHRLGAAGFKEWKRLGLYLKDGHGRLLKVDDPKLDPMWERLGQLHMPVSIHVADPKAFFEPYNERNERWKELKDHPDWWFGDTTKFPTFHELLDALNRVVARHPHTTFVCVHFANDAEELDWVDRSLARYPNMMVDLAARIPELGRHDPETVHRLFIKYQDRILFGTDFQSLESRMILGSSGNEPPPALADAEVFFLKEYRWLETWDRNWPHMTPIQGDWTISSIGLPASVLRKIYFDNARKLLARSLPPPMLRARHTVTDFELNGDLDRTIWQTATPVRLESRALDGAAQPELSTTLRALWSPRFLYLRFDCPFTKLTVFQPALAGQKRFDLKKEGVSLWDRDVVEAFLAPDMRRPTSYGEFEVAPTNERLDVMVTPEGKNFGWKSQFASGTHLDQKAKVWTCELRIPLSALGATAPTAGTRWRANFYRSDRAHRAGLAWNPTLTGTFHTPARFGVLEFVE
jgi:Amidohydrolase/Carbohydrate family 9 binding domain-like